MERGFTLIEILVAFAIISIISVISVPNLRKFINDQELNNTSSDLVRILRQAQSGAMSGVICNPLQPSKDWRVNINLSSSVNYKLFCRNTSNLDSVKYDYTAPSIASNPAGCQPLEVYFTKNKTEFRCNGSPSSATSVSISLSKNGRSYYVTVTNGGSISSWGN